jgi:UDP-2,3-diacylglucosamine hydrolase
MRAYFLSDLHLKDPKEESSKALLSFLRQLQFGTDLTDLFLLGDIFDLWVSDLNYFINKWFELNRELVRLKIEGVKIHYFEGNHDIYLTDYFRDQLGFQIYSGPIDLNWHGVNLHLEHGDEIDQTDKGYLLLRAFLRTKLIRKFICTLPQGVAVWLGESTSQVSREYTSQRPEASNQRIVAMLRDYAKRIYSKKTFDFLVAGHVHVKDEFQIGSGYAINLGSWLNERVVLQITKDASGLNHQWLEL